MAVQPIPEGFHTITPYLTVARANELIDFLKFAFGAEECSRHVGEKGEVRHAQVKIGNSMMMLTEASEKYPPMPTAIYLYVEDTDATYEQALKSGGISLMEPADQYYGDRNAGIKDLSGNQWWIATHIEDVSPEEISKREEALLAKA
jgi:PhnB protein